MCLFMGRQNRDLVTLTNLPGLDLSLKTAERMVRTANSLDGQIKAFFLSIFFDINGFQIF